MFCGVDWQQAGSTCSLENHCPNGDCPSGHLTCWSRVACDVRNFIPFEEGGYLGKPTHKEIAEAMGLTYPSDDVRIYLVCFFLCPFDFELTLCASHHAIYLSQLITIFVGLPLNAHLSFVLARVQISLL